MSKHLAIGIVLTRQWEQVLWPEKATQNRLLFDEFQQHSAVGTILRVVSNKQTVTQTKK